MLMPTPSDTASVRLTAPGPLRDALIRRLCRNRALRLPGYRFLIGRTRRWQAIVLTDGPVTWEDLRDIDDEVRAAGLLRPIHLWAGECRYGDTIAWQVHRLSPNLLRPPAHPDR